MQVIATTLNVRSGPGSDFRLLKQLHEGASVEVLETRGDWSWVDPSGGWVNSAYLAADTVTPPHGLNGILKMFGDPGSPAAGAGRVQLPAPLKLGWQNASVTRVACHTKMVDVFTAVFNEIHSQGLWAKLKTFDGIFNDRPTKNGQKRSTHAWGISIDLNAKTNGMGKKGDMDKRIVMIFEKHGFKWLGPEYDPMHFQFASGY